MIAPLRRAQRRITLALVVLLPPAVGLGLLARKPLPESALPGLEARAALGLEARAPAALGLDALAAPEPAPPRPAAPPSGSGSAREGGLSLRWALWREVPAGGATLELAALEDPHLPELLVYLARAPAPSAAPARALPADARLLGRLAGTAPLRVHLALAPEPAQLLLYSLGHAELVARVALVPEQ